MYQSIPMLADEHGQVCPKAEIEIEIEISKKKRERISRERKKERMNE